MTTSPNERGRPVDERDALTDQSAGKRNESESDSTSHRLTLDPSYFLLCPSDEADRVAELEVGPKEYPAALMRWSSPDDCADELTDVFGKHWCRMLAVALRDRLRKGGLR